MTAKEEVDVLVGVEAEELPDDLDGEDLRVGELGGGSAASDAPPFEPVVVDEAEDGDDEGALRSTREDLRPVRCCQADTERREVFCVLLKASKKLAHGVKINTGRLSSGKNTQPITRAPGRVVRLG